MYIVYWRLYGYIAALFKHYDLLVSSLVVIIATNEIIYSGSWYAIPAWPTASLILHLSIYLASCLMKQITKW